ncbi:maleylpyruvate isomerase N-terminal domain-containing protein [Nocardioides sp. MJB4]|uniref:Maleylpyruvate isomerase N-terminal domain-containing protein n=2 Tax=Nocardioides donggukensis TaxID=2774019 RepID=A0A927K3H7_9ACTN|nr:maleylpyruvate isomerase N-terminal domain-containing protein [Nocardioides donggukensis]
MPQHLDGLRAATVALARYADRAGLGAPVPTTPDWTVRRLLAHQGMVHRWATRILRGEPAAPDAFGAEGLAAPDPVEWLREGAVDLAAALHEAPDDLDVVVFLADAPAPVCFWARRQCHETTVHAVDALSAVLGRLPRAADIEIGDELALDGIDELLCGFLTRPRSRLRAEEPMTIEVRPDGSGRTWRVEVGPGPAVTRCGPPDGVDDRRRAGADVVLRGTPVALYLSLWNRSDEVDVSQGWRDASAITWD